MAPTTRQHREGTLIYDKENRELYMRVDDGVRQVMVFINIFIVDTLLHIYFIDTHCFVTLYFVLQ